MQQIIDYFGGKSALALALGVERSAVSWWLREGLPPGRAVEIERVTQGRFKATEITGVHQDDPNTNEA